MYAVYGLEMVSRADVFVVIWYYCCDFFLSFFFLLPVFPFQHKASRVKTAEHMLASHNRMADMAADIPRINSDRPGSGASVRGLQLTVVIIKDCCSPSRAQFKWHRAVFKGNCFLVLLIT